MLNMQEDRDIPHRWEHLELAMLHTRTQLCPEMLSNPAERLTAPFHPKLLAREDVVEEALHV